MSERGFTSHLKVDFEISNCPVDDNFFGQNLLWPCLECRVTVLQASGATFCWRHHQQQWGGAAGGKDSYRPIYPLSTPSSPSNTVCGKTTNTTISAVNVKSSKLPFFYNLWEPYLTSSFVPLAISLLWQSVIGFQLLYVFNLVKWAKFFSSSSFQNHSEI